MSASPPATLDPSELNGSGSGAVGAGSGAGAATQAALYNQVFGEGSDVSDISDSEDENDDDDDDDDKPQPRRAFPPRPVAPVTAAADDEEEEDDSGARAGAGAGAGRDSDDDEQDQDVDVDAEANAGEDSDADAEADADGGDVYVPGTAERPAKIPKFKKSKSKSKKRDVGGEDEDEDMDGDAGADEEGDGDGDGDEERKKKKKKSEKKKKEKRRTRDVDVEEEEAVPVYDEATMRRMALEERIDNIGKTQRKIKRRKKDEEDIVDSYHEEVCERLRDRMLAAAEKDRIANENKMPGTSKLAMLDDVMAVLRNTTMWQPIQDSRLLDAVTQWLEPIRPSGALPAVGIQKALFEVLPKMDLDTPTLKEARLGPIILFYTKTKRVQPSINRQADALIQAWSRPIIKRPANFRSRYVGGDATQPAGSQGQNQNGQGQSQSQGQAVSGGGAVRQGGAVSGGQIKKQRFDYRKALKENEGRRQAKVQIAQDTQYTLAPESRTVDNEDRQVVARIQADNRKFNKFARQMKMSKGR